MFKLVIIRKDMTSKEFMEKISKLYNIKMDYFSVGYSLTQNPELQVELDMDDSEGFVNAYCLLPSFSKLEVVIKTQISRNISIAMGKPTVRNKEIVSEEIKREMGLHDEEGKRKRDCVNATWMAKCLELMKLTHDLWWSLTRSKVELKRHGEARASCSILSKLCVPYVTRYVYSQKWITHKKWWLT